MIKHSIYRKNKDFELFKETVKAGQMVAASDIKEFVIHESMDNVEKVLVIIKHYIYTHNLKIRENIVYEKVLYSSNTYKPSKNILELESEILNLYSNYSNLLKKNLKISLAYLNKVHILDNFDMGYTHIEYEDFYLDISGNGFSKSSALNCRSFHYFSSISRTHLDNMSIDCYIRIILGTKKFSFSDLDNVIDEGDMYDRLEEVFNYFKFIGKSMGLICMGEGGTKVLLSESNFHQGKLYLTEFVLSSLYTDYLICIEKKSVVDGSPLSINKILENYSARLGLRTRLNSLKFNELMKSLDVPFEDIKKNLALFVYSAILAGKCKSAFDWIFEIGWIEIIMER